MAEDARALAEADPFVVRKGAEETDGEFVRFEVTMYPSADNHISEVDLPHEKWSLDFDGEHIHPEQEERWKVLTGEFRVALEGEEHILNEGEEITLPTGVPHRHWNPTSQPIRLIWERRPAFHDEEWAESLYTLAQAGKTDEDGVPGTLQLAVITDEYPNESVYLTTLPVSIQKLLFSLLASIGRLMGYEATHSREELNADP